MTLTPAYRRDYKTAKAVREAFALDHDFIIADYFELYSGKPINRSQLIECRIPSVNIRFDRLTKVVVVKL